MSGGTSGSIGSGRRPPLGAPALPIRTGASIRSGASIRTLRLAIAALLLGASSAGCGSAVPSPTRTASPTDAAVAATSPTAQPELPAAAASPTPRPAPAVIDPTLLEVLPASVDGHPIAEERPAEDDAVRDPDLGGVVERLAIGIVRSGDSSDWAIATVVLLRPSTWDEGFDRAWRATYDAGTCGSTGGPAGHAEAELAGRTVRITTCGGLRIHHVRLAGPDRLVAVASSGTGRYGERIVGALRP